MKMIAKKITTTVMLIIACIMLVSAISSSALTKKKFDFVIGKDGDFKAAKSAAEKAGGKRFIIFFPNGEYDIGKLTGDSNARTNFTAGMVSFIGQDSKKTVIFNTGKKEGIHNGYTLKLEGNNTYLQDLTVQNKAGLGSGRFATITDWSKYTIYKNVRLISGQDAYYTNNVTAYWEGGEIHGTTDFICGGGDVFFNEVLLWTLKKSYIAAPADEPKWGYVFNKCTIDGVDGYTYGRNWNGGRAVYINTIMKKVVSSAGWGPHISGRDNYILLGEYNSVKADGSKVSTSGRSSWSTILTEAQAAEHTIENVLGDWNPQQYTKQVAAPECSVVGTTLKWKDNDNALCWVVFKDNTFFTCVTETSCEIAGGDDPKKYSVRGANAMGGLGPVSGFDATGVTVGGKTSGKNRKSSFNVVEKTLQIQQGASQKMKLRLFSLEGKIVLAKELSEIKNVQIPLHHLKSGMYLFRTEVDGVVKSGYITIL